MTTVGKEEVEQMIENRNEEKRNLYNYAKLKI